MKHRPQRGFTLLELMVVVVIIGVLVTFATLSIGDRALEDRLQTEAQRLERILHLALEEAELKGIDLGFRYTMDGYEFLALGQDGLWGAYEADDVLRARPLGEPLAIDLRIDGRPVGPAVITNDPAKPVQPQVMLLSSGEVTAFTLALRAKGLSEQYLLQSDALGRMTLERKVEL